MKKYVKPELVYEHFTLNTHIADCGWELQHANKESCFATADPNHYGEGWTTTLFVSTNMCTDTDWEGYCYENGVDDPFMKVFRS